MTARPIHQAGTDDLPAIRHRRRDPLFVVGHGRSGTSILMSLIRKYLRVAFGTESQFIVRYHGLLSRYGDLGQESNLRLLVTDLARERFFERSRRFDFHLDLERVIRDAAPRTYAGVLAAIFGQFAESQQLTRWGDKTPEYSRHLPTLRGLFPNAQFIHVVRDGRDVALSGYEVHFGSKNAYTAATEWLDLLTTVRRFAETAPPGSFLEVRYEDLLAQPQRVFDRLVHFLDIDDPDGDVSRVVGQLARRELRADNFDKWKTRLSVRDRAMFAAVAGPMLASYGYEVEPARRRAPGPIGRVYWEIDNALRRVVVPKYWSDNLYKARLRLRRHLLPIRRWRTPVETRR